MRKRLTGEQELVIESIKKTYREPLLMKLKDMAILAQPKKFAHVNHPRHNKTLTDIATKVFKELAFLLKYLPLSYRYKILISENFDEFLEVVLDMHSVGLSDLDEETKALVIRFATKSVMYGMGTFITTMPKEFREPLKDASKPFIDLITAIVSYGKKKSAKDIPPLDIQHMLSDFFGR